ncbi:MAG: hypothetical protein FRX49_00419 [Trebouxia sp. A1-2]|nr:MAG: hypothetical protein FRX49_00419 [Trebouxia sp. A1-2]
MVLLAGAEVTWMNSSSKLADLQTSGTQAAPSYTAAFRASSAAELTTAADRSAPAQYTQTACAIMSDCANAPQQQQRYCLHQQDSGYNGQARLWSDDNSSPAMLHQAADSQVFAVHVKVLPELPTHMGSQLAAVALLR